MAVPAIGVPDHWPLPTFCRPSGRQVPSVTEFRHPGAGPQLPGWLNGWHLECISTLHEMPDGIVPGQYSPDHRY
jgi:hypothetical protein